MPNRSKYEVSKSAMTRGIILNASIFNSTYPCMYIYSAVARIFFLEDGEGAQKNNIYLFLWNTRIFHKDCFIS